MRIALMTTQIPFVTGGAEMHVANLQHYLREAGHDVTTVSVPFKEQPARTMLDSMMAAGLTDVSEVDGVETDLAIGLKFPGYMMQHSNKVFWVIHQLRTVYDNWAQGTSWLQGDPDGRLIQESVRAADIKVLREARLLTANSRNVANRMKQFCGLDSNPLYHPPPLHEQLTCKAYEDFLFFPSRLSPEKRQELVIEALSKTRAPVKVRFSGTAANKEYEVSLRRMASDYGVADRIEWLGWVDDETLLDNFARAGAVLYPPKDEDYGYVTLQSMLSGKAVVTCSDSGGVLEFVKDRETGLVASPTAVSLAAAMDEVWQEKNVAEKLGQAGLKDYDTYNISWENVVYTLLYPVSGS